MRQAKRAVITRAGSIAALVAAAAALAVSAGAAAAPAAHQASATTVSTHQTKRGKVLAASNGHALYLFAHDSGGKSSCYGSCAKTWTPLLTSGHPIAGKGSGVNAKLLGTTRRQDGKLQVTYNRHPLYMYSRDTAAGQIKGEGANQFGGHWYVVNTSGNAVKPNTSVCNPLCPGY
jgi:predicted lipoprotein with Yx(FWY)xxD motif